MIVKFEMDFFFFGSKSDSTIHIYSNDIFFKLNIFNHMCEFYLKKIFHCVITLPYLFINLFEFYNFSIREQWFEITILNNFHLGSNRSIFGSTLNQLWYTLTPSWTVISNPPGFHLESTLYIVHL